MGYLTGHPPSTRGRAVQLAARLRGQEVQTTRRVQHLGREHEKYTVCCTSSNHLNKLRQNAIEKGNWKLPCIEFLSDQSGPDYEPYQDAHSEDGEDGDDSASERGARSSSGYKIQRQSIVKLDNEFFALIANKTDPDYAKIRKWIK